MSSTAPVSFTHPLLIALSSSALFDTRDSDQVFQTSSLADYVRYQVEREKEPFKKGTAFPLAEVMRQLNAEAKYFEIMIVSKNEPNSGARVMHSLAHYGFQNVRAIFTGGEPVAPFCKAMDVSLFLSREPSEVKRAIEAGVAAGRLEDPPTVVDVEPSQLRIAFDFDGVLASLEAEKVYQQFKPDLEPYRRHEIERSDIPLPKGPLFPVLQLLTGIKEQMEKPRHALFPENEIPAANDLAKAVQISEEDAARLINSGDPKRALFRAKDEGRLEAAGFAPALAAKIARHTRAFFSPIEIALVTARNPPVEVRLMTTLRSWGIAADQLCLIGPYSKLPALQVIRPHIFFDDHPGHISTACNTVPSGLVINNDQPSVETVELKTIEEALQTTSTSEVAVDFVSAIDFERDCRSIFRNYSLDSKSKLDPRFRDFIRENKGRSGAERAVVLARLRPFDIKELATTHEPKFGRDRIDLLVKKLAWIADVSSIREPELPLGDSTAKE